MRLADRRAGDGGGVDLVGLAELACRLALAGHQLGRDAQDALAVLEQEALQAARQAAAVLDRPDALAVDLGRPAQQLAMSVLARRDGSARAARRGQRLERRRGVRVLVRVDSDYDHRDPPSVAF